MPFPGASEYYRSCPGLVADLLWVPAYWSRVTRRAAQATVVANVLVFTGLNMSGGRSARPRSDPVFFPAA